MDNIDKLLELCNLHIPTDPVKDGFTAADQSVSDNGEAAVLRGYDLPPRGSSNETDQLMNLLGHSNLSCDNISRLLMNYSKHPGTTSHALSDQSVCSVLGLSRFSLPSSNHNHASLVQNGKGQSLRLLGAMDTGVGSPRFHPTGPRIRAASRLIRLLAAQKQIQRHLGASV